LRATYALNLAFAAILIAALILPRLVPRGEGFAASGSAVLVLLATLMAAVVLAMAQAGYTWRRRHALSRHEKWLGYAPLVLGTSGLIGLILFLRF
jgi:hypothetical protein